ncbi:MAG: hypothetical protein ACI4WT_02130 [Oligosphaeraceae bacterium]
MSRRLALLLLCLCGAVASAFNAPTDTRHGVTAEILSVHETTAAHGAAVPFQVRLTNRGDAPVTYAVRTYLNDDWTVATPQAAGKLAAQGGTADHAFAGTPLPRCEAAYYPVHALVTVTPAQGDAFELHPIAVFQVRGKPSRLQQAASKPIALQEGRTNLALLPPVRKYVTLFPSMTQLEFDGASHEPSRGHLQLAGGNLQFHPPWNKVVEAGTGDGAGTGLVSVDFRLALPAGKAIRLIGTAAIRHSADNEPPSDGVEYIVRATTADGATKTLLKTFSAEKAALPLEADLSDYAGKTLTLTLAIGPGPAHNTCCDSGVWRTPTLIIGDQPQPLDDAYWQTLSETAHKVLDGQNAPNAFRLPLEGNATAALVLGRDGIVNGILALRCGDRRVLYRGLNISIDQAPIGSEADGRIVRVTRAQQDGNAVTVSHLHQRPNGDVPFTVTLEPRGGALAVRFAMPGVERSLRGEPRFTHLSLGPASEKLWRLYAGFGNVIENPTAPWRLGAGGFTLSTRHVGCDYRNGLSVVQASDLFPDAVACNPDDQRFSLEFHNDATLLLAPSTDGAFAAARIYAAVSGFKPSPGLPMTLGRMCLDQWGGDYELATEDIRLAAQYGLTHSIFVKHVWQRWGYDYRLPEIYPPEGGLEPFRALSDACRESGILFAPHDNYIDFYPDAKGYSYDHIIYNADRTPQKAWYNKGRKAQSYRWLPHAFSPWMVENMKLIRDGIAPQGLFIDVFTAIAPKDYYDRNGKLHTADRMAREWANAFDTCRDILMPGSPMISEAGHDGLIGSIDAVQADHFPASNWGVKAEAMDRTPWHDIVTHGKMVLLAGGLGHRYGKANSDGYRGYASDDYLSNTVLGGRNPMCDGPFSRNAVMTYWLLHDVCDVLAHASFDSHRFGETVMRQSTVFDGGKARVWANRGETPWKPDGVPATLPRFGFWTQTPNAVAGVFETPQGQRVGYARSQDSQGVTRIFADARPPMVTSIRGNNRVSASTSPLTLKGRTISFTVTWDVRQPPKRMDKLNHFIHINHPSAKNGEGILYHGSVVRTTLDLTKTGTYTSDIALTLPQDAPAGHYDIRFGLYGPHGRLDVTGRDASGSRVLAGTFTLADDGTIAVSREFASQPSAEASLSLPLADFGDLQTNGALRVIRTGANGCTLIPLPGSMPMKVVINLDRLGLAGRRLADIECLPFNGVTGAKPAFSQHDNRLELTLDAISFGYQLKF